MEEQCECCFDVNIADFAKTQHPSPNFPAGNLYAPLASFRL